jgi:hypothetical protein
MSETIEVKVDADITVEVEHIVCSDCGEEVEYELDTDCYGRALRITVSKHVCEEQANE